MSLIDPSVRYWMTDSTRVVARDDLVSDGERSVCRPVVVIDPEDREQVERLTKALAWALHPDDADRLADALRSLIAPKPPEPKEFAALAVERDGTVWHRVRDTESDGHRFPWATRDSCASWDRLDIVAVYPAPKPEVTA